MNKRLVILLHVAAWLVMFLSPLMFINHGRGTTPLLYMLMSAVPLAFMLVFYINYLWLTPRFFVDGHHRYFFCINIIMIVALGVGLHFWMLYVHGFETAKHHEPSTWNSIGFILRDIFNLSIAAAIATTIQLARRWQKAETARKDAEAARVNAELSNLRSQINPHFLLNTLNNIYALTAIDTQRAQDAIQQLSKMLRHMLYDYEQPTVPLKDEVDFLKNYVSLMRIRLPQTVEVKSQVSILNPQQQVAPMIFISLLENAFKHGISPSSPSFIHMQLTADAHSITCEIENSNHPKNEQDRSGHGIGLTQVQRRLELAYPGQYSWERGASEDGSVYRSRIQIFNQSKAT